MMLQDIKKASIAEYIDDSCHGENLRSLRTIALFGKNVATYKFALALALLKVKTNRSGINFEDLQEDFLNEFLLHYEEVPEQFSSGKPTRFTLACDRYIESGKTQSGFLELKDSTASQWHNYVFDAFHNVGGGSIAKKWWLFEHDSKGKSLVLTDRLLELRENPLEKKIMIDEILARWSIVQSAWAAGVSTNLVTHSKTEGLVISNESGSGRRVSLRSALDALLPYQKGRCFYCDAVVDKTSQNSDDLFPDVDHFFAHSYIAKLKEKGDERALSINKDGIWNLVIACKACNRGAQGKFDSRPPVNFFEKLVKRNMLFTEEHKHAFRSGVLTTLGVSTSTQMQNKMNGLWNEFEIRKIWTPKGT
ncbi:hypothetical protein AN392_01469 [Pseudoalteromonas sp. P1-16-1b]|uniref:HNH endonuclease domain-containing protein n=1 Tax=Pseudoalteromonas sp. P1-16-1b TaxID=1723757 RepID=UPI0006E601FF|nr:HNH endonuclease domain-containing protein [Pseudoalteromonas sp. P1-16-1b]KPZ65315.1 hypothetical protein AN392_01469 [Pseudoalteromonas sp. P1-16-1b]